MKPIFIIAILIILFQENNYSQIRVNDTISNAYIPQHIFLNRIVKVTEDSLLKDKLFSMNDNNSLKNMLKFLRRRFKTNLFDKFNRCCLAEVHYKGNGKLESIKDSIFYFCVMEINFSTKTLLNNTVNVVNKEMALETFYGSRSFIQTEVAFLKKENSLIITWCEYSESNEFYSFVRFLKKDFEMIRKQLDCRNNCP